MELHALLERLGPVRRHGTRALVSCPNHDDAHPSLEVAAGEKSIILICRAGCPQREVIQAMCAKAGIRPRDLFWEAQRPIERRLVATYDYYDAEGRLLFQTVRYVPKAFRQRRPNGAGGWLWNLHGIEPVLYRLPAVQAAIAAGQTIYLVEGEKDTDALHQIGLTATCNPMGAKKWCGSYSHALRDALVVIVPDNDPPGQAHAALVAAALRGIAKAVRILPLPNLPPKGDVSDWLAARGSRGELEALAAATAAQNGTSPVSAATPTPSATASPIPMPYSDYPNAVALVRAYGQDFRFCYPWKRWLVWTGTHWAEDTSGAVMRVAKDTITHRV
jgi:putative DNA primase/helicase